MTAKFRKSFCRQVKMGGSIMTANLKGQGHYDCKIWQIFWQTG